VIQIPKDGNTRDRCDVTLIQNGLEQATMWLAAMLVVIVRCGAVGSGQTYLVMLKEVE
jgi:hypothetical protein